MPRLPPPSASADSSPDYSAGANPLVGDAGPAFDPKSSGAQAPATPLTLTSHEWEAPRIRTILRAQGLLTHEAVGVGVEDWIWRESELEAISEPLANAANKLPVVRAAAAVSDELTVGAVFFEYAFRSIKERSRILRAIKEAEEAEIGPQPVTPAAPIGGTRTFVTGAGPDPEVQAEPAEPVAWEVP